MKDRLRYIQTKYSLLVVILGLGVILPESAYRLEERIIQLFCPGVGTDFRVQARAAYAYPSVHTAILGTLLLRKAKLRSVVFSALCRQDGDGDLTSMPLPTRFSVR